MLTDIYETLVLGHLVISGNEFPRATTYLNLTKTTIHTTSCKYKPECDPPESSFHQ